MNVSTDVNRLVERLADRNLRLVLAESCTGGMVSAELTGVPGVSQWYCGSAVTYRGDTKTSWLGVSAAEIQQHTAVSKVVARQMAAGVLERTPEADIAASVTGHFGPNSPAGFDALVFIATARRDHGMIVTDVQHHHLSTMDRLPRQREATALVLTTLMQMLDSLA
jgi:PncC family amidohydrolase